MKILMVLTSHDQLGNTGRKTGSGLRSSPPPISSSAMPAPTSPLASPKGGQPPLDPKSNEPGNQTDDTRRFEQEPRAIRALAHTVKLSDIDQALFDGVFFPGGHGPTLGSDERPPRAVAHRGYAGREQAGGARVPRAGDSDEGEDAEWRFHRQGPAGHGLSDSEEAAVHLVDVVPYLLEDVLKEQGATFSAKANWGVNVVQGRPAHYGAEPAVVEANRSDARQCLEEATPLLTRRIPVSRRLGKRTACPRTYRTGTCPAACPGAPWPTHGQGNRVKSISVERNFI